MFKNFLLIFLILLFVKVYGQEDIKGRMVQINNKQNKTDIPGRIVYDEKLFDFDFSFPQKVNDLDTISLPIIYSFEIFVDDLYGVDIQNDYFFSKLFLAAYSDYDSLGLLNNGDNYSSLPKNNFKIRYQKGDASKFSDWYYQGFIDDSLYNQYAYVSEIENDFFHNWNLRDFPFDTQELKIEFISSRDTSEVILKQSENFPPDYNKSISDLKEGYKIVGITSESSFYESPFDQISDSNTKRKKIFSKLTFKVLVDRSGSWLFIKLFLGSFLSFFISWIVFMIPLKEFESRIGLSVGAIFGAIGNRYFVDSAMSNVQVLTKADLINNLVLILLVFNILIVILQQSKEYSIPYLENNSNAMKISAIALALFTSFIMIL